MKYILLLLMSVNLMAMKPVVEVPQLPGDIQLEAYEESEELFVSKVMEYYQIAVMYKSQLASLAIKPDEKVIPPSLEELNDMELDVIIKYYNLAKSLEGQIESTNYVEVRSEINALKDTVERLKAVHQDQIWDLKNSYLQRELEVANQRDSICHDRIEDIEDKINSGCRDCKNFFSVGVTENIFFHNESFVDSKPNIGVRVALNTSKLFGFGKNISFWYEYQAPRFVTTVGEEDDLTAYRWNSHLSSMGVASDFYPVVNTEDFSNGLKFGAGYFWAEGTIYNNEFGAYYWEGGRVDLEYFIGSNSPRFPFELFLSGSMYHSFNSDLNFLYGDGMLAEGNKLSVGRSQFSINIGVRYNFWSSSF